MRCERGEQGVAWFVFGDRSITELAYSTLSVQDTNPKLPLCALTFDRRTSLILENKSFPFIYEEPNNQNVLRKQNVVEQCQQQKWHFSQMSAFRAERNCWNALMTMKVWSFMQSPFNVTLMIDTDNVANYEAKHKIGWHPLDDLIGSLGTFDLSGVHVEKYSAFSFCGGFLLYRTTNRFRALWKQWLNLSLMADVTNEQKLLNHLVQNLADYYLDMIRLGWFPPNWSCKAGMPGELEKKEYIPYNRGRRINSCFFWHNHPATLQYMRYRATGSAFVHI